RYIVLCSLFLSGQTAGLPLSEMTRWRYPDAGLPYVDPMLILRWIVGTGPVQLNGKFSLFQSFTEENDVYF
ncbi:MAG: hypothetical protein ACTS5I_11240, partial [Rhodanobacter sp.]